MSNLSNRETAIVKAMVRMYDKSAILSDYEEFYDRAYSPICDSVVKILGLRLPTNPSPAVQYLKYAYDYFEDIQDNNFENDIERAKLFSLTYSITETQVLYKTYAVEVYSFLEDVREVADKIEGDLWDWDPNEIDVDYGDSDTERIEFDDWDEIDDEFEI